MSGARAAAQAVPAEEETMQKEPSPTTEATGAVGAFLPFSQAASVQTQRGYVLGLGGYDGARKAGMFETASEVRFWGPIALRAGAVYTTGADTVKPSVGGRVQLLREQAHGVDGAIGVFYRPEGLTEPEGEIESAISVGLHLGKIYLLGNLLYGQDGEGNERDGEVRVAALGPLVPWLSVGFDSRVRFDLGSDRATLLAHNEPTFDALAGPLATAFVGPLALSLQGGASVFRLPGQFNAEYGAFFMSGVGTAF